MLPICTNFNYVSDSESCNSFESDGEDVSPPKIRIFSVQDLGNESVISTIIIDGSVRIFSSHVFISSTRTTGISSGGNENYGVGKSYGPVYAVQKH